MSKWIVQKWGCKSGVSLHLVGSFRNLSYHHIGLSLCYE